jgi:hypothetical protein
MINEFSDYGSGSLAPHNDEKVQAENISSIGWLSSILPRKLIVSLFSELWKHILTTSLKSVVNTA